jgi:hypothetical protein
MKSHNVANIDSLNKWGYPQLSWFSCEKNFFSTNKIIGNKKKIKFGRELIEYFKHLFNFNIISNESNF